MDFSRYYHTRVRKSVDEDRVRIVATFRDLLKSGSLRDFRLVTYYKGLPISYPATVVEISSGVLDLDVHQQQAVALESTQQVFIRCSSFDSAILADVQNVDVRRMTAALKNFRFVEVMADRRESLRLELEPRTEVGISGAIGTLQGTLSDISLGGCCVRTQKELRMERGTQWNLRLNIPNLLHNSMHSIETSSCYLDSTRQADEDVCSFSFESDPNNEAIISRYIFQRQVEIIRELKEAT